jgi:hypothetical protein
VTNFLIDMKLGAAALVEGNSQAVVDFMRQRSNSQFVSTAWNTAGDKAYRRCVVDAPLMESDTPFLHSFT